MLFATERRELGPNMAPLTPHPIAGTPRSEKSPPDRSVADLTVTGLVSDADNCFARRTGIASIAAWGVGGRGRRGRVGWRLSLGTATCAAGGSGRRCGISGSARLCVVSGLVGQSTGSSTWASSSVAVRGLRGWRRDWFVAGGARRTVSRTVTWAASSSPANFGTWVTLTASRSGVRNTVNATGRLRNV